MVGKLEDTSASPGGLVTTQIPGPQPRVSESVGLGWGLSTCISYTFPGDADATGLGTTLENNGTSSGPAVGVCVGRGRSTSGLGEQWAPPGKAHNYTKTAIFVS